MTAWQWRILPPLLAQTFRPRDETPLPIWAKAHVFLNRKITTKPGFYDIEEFPWTWDFQEIIRTRRAPDTGEEVTQITWMKSSVAGVTEAALNGIRWMSQNDPQNVIFSIDNRVEAGNINEIRLQPTLRQLGEQIFTDRDEDVGKFLLKLRRMLVYFLGSYSSGAFANKMAEVAIGDELEEHGRANTGGSSVDNLRSRLKSAARPLLILMSKPQLAGGPIDAEHSDGSCHVYEIPCPHCGVHQQLEQDNMRFDHCRDLLGQWDKRRVLDETFFECIHCKKPIEEHHKRWFNDRARARWRRTNPNATPGHVSFHISDFYGYHPDARWGRLALKYIKSKGNPVARQGYRNHHEGLAWEQRITKTSAEDILACRAAYRRGCLPRKPFVLILGADVGLLYVKWVIHAFARNGESWVVDWGISNHPNTLPGLLATKRYLCAEDGKSYPVSFGYIDAKYRKREVHQVCLKSAKKLWPAAGISADLSIRSISFNHIPTTPRWYGVTVFIDRDAKHELYTERIKGWVDYRAGTSAEAEDEPSAPNAPPIWFPEELTKGDDFTKEHCNEHLIQKGGDDQEFLPETAKEFVWRRKGPNHWGDASKIAIVGFRWITRHDAPAAPKIESEVVAKELEAALALEDAA